MVAQQLLINYPTALPKSFKFSVVPICLSKTFSRIAKPFVTLLLRCFLSRMLVLFSLLKFTKVISKRLLKEKDFTFNAFKIINLAIHRFIARSNKIPNFLRYRNTVTVSTVSKSSFFWILLWAHLRNFTDFRKKKWYNNGNIHRPKLHNVTFVDWLISGEIVRKYNRLFCIYHVWHFCVVSVLKLVCDITS